MSVAMDAWAEFLGKATTAVKAKKIKGEDAYTQCEFEWGPVKKVTVGREEAADDVRPVWSWSLCETEETGIRRSWLSGEVLEDGQCMIHLEARWGRGLHVSELKPEDWHWILGQPQGGDGRIMGSLKSKYTREAKKEASV